MGVQLFESCEEAGSEARSDPLVGKEKRGVFARYPTVVGAVVAASTDQGVYVWMESELLIGGV